MTDGVFQLLKVQHRKSTKKENKFVTRHEQIQVARQLQSQTNNTWVN